MNKHIKALSIAAIVAIVGGFAAWIWGDSPHVKNPTPWDIGFGVGVAIFIAFIIFIKADQGSSGKLPG